MRRRFLVSAGATTLLVALAGCTSGTEQPRESPKSVAGTPSAAARPAVTQRPYDRASARPLGEAAATGRDAAFLRAAFASQMPTGHEVPPVDEVAVIHRLSAGTGELAWMADGRTFCYGMVREDTSSFRCGRPSRGGACCPDCFSRTGVTATG